MRATSEALSDASSTSIRTRKPAANGLRAPSAAWRAEAGCIMHSISTHGPTLAMRSVGGAAILSFPLTLT
eukprot:scaffold168194_cov30-Tisochrysis_lutea.AAC.1